MDKKRKNILVWILAWAGLLVAVLYSPVGSPDLYVAARYSSHLRGGMYGAAKISDVPTLKTNVTGGSGATGNQAYSTGFRGQNQYSVSGNNFDAKFNSGSTGFFSNSGIQNARDKTSTVGSSWITISSFGSRGSNNSTVAQNTGVVSMSTDMSMFEDYSTTKQSVGAGGDGGTDPGGDPTGPVIPVGDGWIIMLALVSGYTIWKKFIR